MSALVPKPHSHKERPEQISIRILHVEFYAHIDKPACLRESIGCLVVPVKKIVHPEIEGCLVLVEPLAQLDIDEFVVVELQLLHGCHGVLRVKKLIPYVQVGGVSGQTGIEVILRLQRGPVPGGILLRTVLGA